MTAYELIKYMLAPAGIVGVIIDNLNFHLPAFTEGETITILAGVVMAIGYFCFYTEVKRKSEIAEKKAQALAEYEKFKEEQARKEALRLADEEFQYRWARLMPKLEVWRSEITGAGRNPKEGWL